jgi:hypothetical protein
VVEEGDGGKVVEIAEARAAGAGRVCNIIVVMGGVLLSLLYCLGWASVCLVKFFCLVE